MKLSSAALLALALSASATEARAGARRTAHRRAQDDAAAAADVADMPDDELTADAAGNGGASPMCPCAEDKVRGVIHFVVPEIPDIPEQQCCPTTTENYSETMTEVTFIQGVTSIAEQYPIPTVGGIAIAYNTDQEVEFKSANGSTFDINSCYLEKANKDFPFSVLLCPVIPGQALTLEVSDTYYGTCDMEPTPPDRRKLDGPDGIIVALEVDYGIGCGIRTECRDRLRRSLEEQKNRRVPVTNGYVTPPGVTATFQCGRYKCDDDHNSGGARGIVEQNTQFLSIGLGEISSSTGPLGDIGTAYSFDLAGCNVSPAITVID